MDTRLFVVQSTIAERHREAESERLLHRGRRRDDRPTLARPQGVRLSFGRLVTAITGIAAGGAGTAS